MFPVVMSLLPVLDVFDVVVQWEKLEVGLSYLFLCVCWYRHTSSRSTTQKSSSLFPVVFPQKRNMQKKKKKSGSSFMVADVFKLSLFRLHVLKQQELLMRLKC